MAGEGGVDDPPPAEEESSGMDMVGAYGTILLKMSDLSAKKATSARRRRQQIRRLRSIDGLTAAAAAAAASSSSDSSPSSSFTKRTRQGEEDDEEAAGSSTDAFPSAAATGWARPAVVRHGAVSLIGKRREMEDAVTVAPGFSPAYDFFGVYDGHGGSEVAETCRERMHVVLARELVEAAGKGAEDGGRTCRWREVMEACFHKVDGEVDGRTTVEGGRGEDAGEKTVGSTAVVAVVGSTMIVVANCGDSRAVLCRGGVAVPLSSDHKPNRPDELERVEAAGGRVIDWDGHRVLGVLATSRSIGDQYLKPFVTSEPEVTMTDRTDRDEFLILASDGLWDVVSSEMACRLTRRCMDKRIAGLLPQVADGSSDCAAAFAATALAELAISRGSRDNISVVVVVL